VTDTLLASAGGRVRALAAECDALAVRPEAARMAVRLRQALAQLADAPAAPRPLVVGLLGGTGVGKSHLFNALVGRPEASPTSADVRPRTARPVAAVSPADRPVLLPLLEDLHADVVPGGVPGVAFLDAPDVDSVETLNRETARHVVSACDLVVYVTDPHKRANFAVHDEVRDWALRKRWFFVLNKADHADGHLDAARSDFDRRLRELHFEPGDGVRFAVSATHPDRYEFERLRAALFAERSARQRAMLPADRFLGHALYALDPELTAPLAALAEALAREEDRLNERVREAYRAGLSSPEVTESLAAVVREQTWRQLAAAVGGPMAAAVALRNRLGLFSTSFQVAAFLGRGPLLLSLAGVVGSAVLDLVRGLLPLRRVVAGLGPEFRRALDTAATDARRALEDHGLGDLAPPPEPTPDPAAAATREGLMPTLPLPLLGPAVEAVLARLARPAAPGDEMLRHLHADVTRLSGRAARSVAPAWVRFAANLLPCVAVFDVVGRLGSAWVRSDYLPGAFYLMAAGVLMASVLPGYLLLASRVRARAGVPHAATVVAGLDEPLATSGLRAVRRRLEGLTADAARLRHELQNTRRAVGEELAAARLGAQAAD
jgi:hypothetical protein